MGYNVDYYKFMISRFGETEETSTIKDYFGYADLNNTGLGTADCN